MFGITHVLAGGAIGKHVKPQYVALPIAFASHFALDAMPHVDTVTYLGLGGWKSDLAITGDAAAAFALLLLLTRRQPRWRAILRSGIAAVIMDVIVMLPIWFPATTAWPIIWHLCRLHQASNGSLPPCVWLPGLLTQLIIILAAGLLLIRPSARRAP